MPGNNGLLQLLKYRYLPLFPGAVFTLRPFNSVNSHGVTISRNSMVRANDKQLTSSLSYILPPACDDHLCTRRRLFSGSISTHHLEESTRLPCIPSGNQRKGNSLRPISAPSTPSAYRISVSVCVCICTLQRKRKPHPSRNHVAQEEVANKSKEDRNARSIR